MDTYVRLLLHRHHVTVFGYATEHLALLVVATPSTTETRVHGEPQCYPSTGSTALVLR